jgi:nucleotide-binding universal stress UspA family protein
MKPDLVLVGTDGSDQSFSAVEWAAREAAMRGAALRIVAVPIMPKRMSWRHEPEGTPDVVADLIASSYERALA